MSSRQPSRPENQTPRERAITAYDNARRKATGGIEDAQDRVRMDPGYTRRSFKEKWGLAVTTRFDNPVRDTGLGPNLKIWKSLPPADQEAWAHTLWGEDPTDPEADFVFAFDEEDLSSTGGCTRRAPRSGTASPPISRALGKWSAAASRPRRTAAAAISWPGSHR